jgi:hypothetical protein
MSNGHWTRRFNRSKSTCQGALDTTGPQMEDDHWTGRSNVHIMLMLWHQCVLYFTTVFHAYYYSTSSMTLSSITDILIVTDKCLQTICHTVFITLVVSFKGVVALWNISQCENITKGSVQMNLT